MGGNPISAMRLAGYCDMICVGTRSGSGFKLQALGAASGERFWQLQSEDWSVRIDELFWASDPSMFIVKSGRTIFACDADTGDQVWQIDLEERAPKGLAVSHRRVVSAIKSLALVSWSELQTPPEADMLRMT